MKFYKIKFKLFGLADPKIQKTKTAPSAYLERGMVGWELVHDVENLEDEELDSNKINNQIESQDVPVFDYFVLKGVYGDRKKNYDWILLDAYNMALDKGFVLAKMNSRLVSPRLKKVFEYFKLPQHRFYSAKLLFKGKKFDYFIFLYDEFVQMEYSQTIFSIKEEYYSDNIFERPDEERSKRFEDEKIIEIGRNLGVNNKEDYLELSIKLRKENKHLDGHYYAFSTYYDYFFLDKTGGFVISERLKQALEDAGITGFEYEDLGDKYIQFINQTEI